MRRRLVAVLAFIPLLACARDLPAPAAIDAEVARLLKETGAKGLAIAVIDEGRPVHVAAHGVRNTAGDPLQVDTIMYGASLTKAVFAYTVMQQVEQGRMGLDTPLADSLPKPLPAYVSPQIVDRYADWSALDERWRKLTPRILLTHSSGFANFGFLEPDEKLHFHFDPGSRYAYSGDGLNTLQFVMETGLGIDVGAQTTRIFEGLGMHRTSLIWRPDFAGNLADGWDAKGNVEPHDERSKVRAAGSMDTTIADLAKFVAAYVRGDGLSRKGRAELVRPQLPITTRSQFPSLQDELPAAQRRKDLAAGLGVVVFDGPQGHGFFKGGHNDTTANTLVCVEAGQRCVVILSNDVRVERRFPDLVRFVLGDTGVPYDWEYGTP
ncbi:serine hydrolase domain-containing protein [Lysobacter sp. LF1]|uniref:Serine hydrolase domain-containing protein n=1 Tax=Lysobacter stagni TaxID=3045172 RepID=A0ABT6XH53_9GAMM|nr:serine hydrolase domain-containing protein [Lysobacter sp. LF1]MDI9239489.1 serine hydrolase domain-containing protein [Lysobacter sp. LF1]